MESVLCQGGAGEGTSSEPITDGALLERQLSLARESTKITRLTIAATTLYKNSIDQPWKVPECLLIPCMTLMRMFYSLRPTVRSEVRRKKSVFVSALKRTKLTLYFCHGSAANL